MRDRGVDVGEPVTAMVLRRVGHYRLTGYLGPYRESEVISDGAGRDEVHSFDRYQPGTALADSVDPIDFD